MFCEYYAWASQKANKKIIKFKKICDPGCMFVNSFHKTHSQQNIVYRNYNLNGYRFLTNDIPCVTKNFLLTFLSS